MINLKKLPIILTLLSFLTTFTSANGIFGGAFYLIFASATKQFK